MRFRYDINGLRAIAVLAVVIFHFNPAWLPGGFAGVDIFFVISGFLMTRIIFNGLQNNSFSLSKFYVSRANRIIPALAVLCLALLVFGWFHLPALDYKTLGKHVYKSLLFVSNHTYLNEAGYFDTSSHEKWLLHTWSLSVEWQFYIIYPLVLLLLSKFFCLEALKKTVAIGALLGFSVSVFATMNWPNSAYYLLPTRAWEMMFGGLAFLYPLNIKKKKLVEYSGLLLLGITFVLVSSNTPWPGHYALLPVLGTYLIIVSNRQTSLVTNNKVFQFLGSCSYSIYLWHWPFVVAIYYFSLNQEFIYVGLILSILVGYLSKTYVESIKFKNNFESKAQYLKCKPIYLVLFIGLLGRTTYSTTGFDWHYPESILTIMQEKENKNPRGNECSVGEGTVPECIYGKGELGAIVIGDSHAQSMIRSIEKSLPNNKSVLDWTMSGCRTIEDVFNTRNKGVEDHSCGQFIKYAVNKLKDYPNVPVVVVNRYNAMLLGPNEGEYQGKITAPTEFTPNLKGENQRSDNYLQKMNSGFIETICSLSENNPVFLTEQTPELINSVPDMMAKEIMKGHENFRVKVSLSEYEKRNRAFYEMFNNLKEKCDVQLIPVKNTLCNNGYCYGDLQGRPMYFDDNHLSEFGASQLIPNFQQALNPKTS